MSSLKYYDQTAGEWKYVAVPLVGQPVEVKRGGSFPNLPLSGATQLLVGSITFDQPTHGGMLDISAMAYADIPDGVMSVVGTFLSVSLDGGATKTDYAGTSGGMHRATSSLRVQRESLSNHFALDVSGATGSIVVELWAYQAAAAGGNATILNGHLVGRLYSGGPVVLDNRYAKQPGSWIEFPFANGWVNYNSTAWQDAQYRLEPGNVVRLRGLVSGSSSTGVVIGILPSGFTPPYETMFSCPALDDTSSSTGMARVDVQPSGNVVLRTFSDLTPAWLGLFDISFSIDST